MSNDKIGQDKVKISYMDAILFPFSEKKCIRRMWWVFLMSLVPALELIVFRGWRLNIVRRIGRKEEHILPELKNFGRFLADGIVLWTMYFLYYIPAIVFLAVFGSSSIDVLLNVLYWIVNKFFLHNEVQAFGVMFGQVITALLMSLAVPIVYVIFVGPIYRAAMIRFSVSGKISSFFSIISNIKLVSKNLPDFMLVFFIEKVNFIFLAFLAAFVSSILTATGVGIVLLPIVIPVFFLSMNYWTTGYLFGQLGVNLALLSKDIE